ncbi:hypothetical protein BGZ72_010910 [Mortierella alpina]|nr:hypothetical protein BGZ72_010910 [Mortierella alpina]
MDDLDRNGHELMSRPLVTLLDYNPRLTYLNLPFDFFEIDGASAAVSKLRHLQYLQVHPSNCDPSMSTIQKPFLLLQSCLALPELTELRFVRDVQMSWDDEDSTTVARKLAAIIHEATLARFSRNPAAKRIKSLQLPTNLSGIWNPLPLILLKSKLVDLETCVIPWFRPDVTPREIQWVVREHCPNLKNLVCPPFFEEGQEDGQAARAFIRGCRGLRSFFSYYFFDGPDHAPRMMLSELVKHHHTTLEVLDLIEPHELFSRDLQRVLSQCKHLKRFSVIGTDDMASMSGIAFRDISSSDWVCTELRELCVTLNRCRSRGDAFGGLGEEEQQDDPRVWLAASTTKRVYQQIGRLGKLEVLEIDIDRTPRTKAKEHDYVWDLTLSKGYLNEMVGLKNLKSLRLRADFWSEMGQAEVEFMHEHWPLLNEIIFDSDNLLNLRPKYTESYYDIDDGSGKCRGMD